ncbi:hypothetical protein GLYMA_16G166400v4 [Glycine max]|uniref:Uncharacterized protein n=1 Tax=Glycine max TaxID=3847 RepID=I1MP63_SOYBN|nr:hypothetical protein GLYMA_16G166400v4 [Glycine max]
MLSKLRARKACQDWKPPRDAPKSVNFHEEYHKALRTKSYVDFFDKAQLLANQPSIYSNHNKFSEILLEPDQETIYSVIDHISKTPELKNLMLSYFDISAEASFICSHLLQSINQVQCNYQFIERALGIMDDDDSLEKFKLISFELNSFIFSKNPLSNLNINHDLFKLISDENSSVLLHRLKSMRKKLGRKVKLMTYLKKASEICVAVYDLVAITANVTAAHTLSTLIMGPTILNFPCKSLNKRELPHLRFSRRRFLSNVCDQLDIAAKGTYILNKDFDTMTRVVARLYDEIEHKRTMVQFFLDKKDDKFSLQMVKELKKSGDGFRKQVEELKEHVYLCLVTINRARCLVTEEMTKMCTEGIGSVDM